MLQSACLSCGGAGGVNCVACCGVGVAVLEVVVCGTVWWSVGVGAGGWWVVRHTWRMMGE